MIERTRRILLPEQLDIMLPQLLSGDAPFPLTVTGGSMLPFLVSGRDAALLVSVTRPLRKGDMVLYRRDNGSWVLHRIHRIRGDSLTLLGDAQSRVEAGIRPEQVHALVCGVLRKGRHLGPGSFLWEFFEHIWPWFRPLHPGIIGLYTRIRRWGVAA